MPGTTASGVLAADAVVGCAPGASLPGLASLAATTGPAENGSFGAGGIGRLRNSLKKRWSVGALRGNLSPSLYAASAWSSAVLDLPSIGPSKNLRVRNCSW